MQEEFEGLLGCLPPWFTENITLMCDRSFNPSAWQGREDAVWPALDRSYHALCPAPCTTMHIRSRLVRRPTSQPGIKARGNVFKATSH